MAIRFLGFLATVLLLTALSWLLVGSFVVDLVPGGGRTLAAAWILSIVPLFVLVRTIALGRYPSAAVRLFVFRPFWYVQLLMLVLALLAFAGLVVGLAFGAGHRGGTAVILIAAPALALIALWGYLGTRRLAVREVVFRPARLPAALDGLRVVQLTDLHVGPHTSRSHLARVAGAVTDARPDLLVSTGDQVDDHPRDIDVFASALGQLRAPLGVYAIPGNHDIYAGWSDVRRRLEAIGVTVLVNRAVKLTHNGVEFWLAGTGDPAGLQFARAGESGAPDVDRTMAAVPPSAFSIVLAHNPALFPALARRGADVVLSGHTHHGQLSIPSRGWSLASVFVQYAMNRYELDAALLYVSPGTNYWGIPFRIGALPEVSVIILRAP